MRELFETKLKRNREKPSYRWTDEQTLLLLQMVADTIKGNPERFEKPISQKFYEKIIDEVPALNAITWLCAKNKMRNLRATYISATTWLMNTGSELLENGDESTVRSHILKICPHYDILEDVYGHKQSGASRFIFDTNEGVIVVCESAEEEQNEEIVGKPLNEDPLTTDSSTSFARAKTPIKRLKPEGQRRLKTESMDAMSRLYDIQEKRIKIEMDKLEFEKEKEKNNTELKKMELENERLKLESEERLTPEGQRRLETESMDPMSKLFDIQEKRIQIEMDKLAFEKEKEKNNKELKKIELANERLKLESEERIKKLELQLKYQNSI